VLVALVVGAVLGGAGVAVADDGVGVDSNCHDYDLVGRAVLVPAVADGDHITFPARPSALVGVAGSLIVLDASDAVGLSLCDVWWSGTPSLQNYGFGIGVNGPRAGGHLIFIVSNDSASDPTAEALDVGAADEWIAGIAAAWGGGVESVEPGPTPTPTAGAGSACADVEPGTLGCDPLVAKSVVLAMALLVFLAALGTTRAFAHGSKA
jgi:hypothetical protein